MRPNPILMPLLRVCLVLIVFSILFTVPANAQRRRTPGINADGDVLSGSNHSSGGGGSSSREDGWAVAVNSGYENPDKDLREDYKAAPTFGLTITRRKSNWLFTASADYRSYQPKQAFLTGIDDIGIFERTLSNFNGIGIYAGIAYSLPVTDQFDINGGLNVGSVFIKQSVDLDYYGIGPVSYSGNSSVNYFGPKLGLNFAASSNLSVGIEGRYGLNVTGFHASTQTDTEVIKGFSASSANLQLTYYF